MEARERRSSSHPLEAPINIALKPLLDASTTPSDPEKTSAERHTDSLPYMKLLPLLVARCSEGLNYAVIFPYINQMIHSFGVPETSVGVWSVTAESSLMVTETIIAPLYGPISDIYGRRYIFLIAVSFFGFFAVAFGFASSVWQVILLRACLGLCAGCGVLSRTMVSEMCGRSSRIKGFALFSPSITVGITIAPLIGGFLSSPVPRLLPESARLFSTFPYLLPAIVVGSTGILAAIIGLFYLPETLPKAKRKARTQAQNEKPSGGVGTLLRYRPFQNVLILYGLQQAVMFSWDAVFPLFAFTSKDLGGLGLNIVKTQDIGIVLAISALLSILMTVFVFPFLHRHIPENLYLRCCLAAYPIGVVFYPIMWSLNYDRTQPGLNVQTWIVLFTQMTIRRIGDFAQTMLDAIVLDSIPGPEHLASANSLTFSIAAAGRAVGPFIIGWLFSITTTFSNPLSLGGQLVWIVFTLIGLPTIYFAYRMKGDAEYHKDHGGREEAEETYELMADSSDSRA